MKTKDELLKDLIETLDKSESTDGEKEIQFEIAQEDIGTFIQMHVDLLKQAGKENESLQEALLEQQKGSEEMEHKLCILVTAMKILEEKLGEEFVASLVKNSTLAFMLADLEFENQENKEENDLDFFVKKQIKEMLSETKETEEVIH